MGRLYNEVVKYGGRVGKNTLNAEANVMHQCCKGEGKRGGCQSTSPSRNAVSAPPRAQEGVKSWLQHSGNFASD